MKKLLSLLSAVLFVFASCSKDDNNESSDPVSSILVKKITTIDGKGNSSSESYLYNGNKIISMTEDDGSVTKYTYTGDLITKIDEIAKDGSLNYTTAYSYINGKIDSAIGNDDDDTYYYKTKYTYNQDGTVSYDSFRGVTSTGVEEEYGATGKYTFKDGNIVKLEVSYYGREYSYIYEYDTKNNPLKNVLGYNLLLDDVSFNYNNIIKETSTFTSETKTDTFEEVNTYKYNENNYPTEKITKFSGSNDTETVQYVY